LDYSNADYDLAGACWLLARVLQKIGNAEQALPLVDEALQRFEIIAKKDTTSAENMVAVCLSDQGNCLLALGRFDDAAIAYENSIRQAEKCKDERQAAIGKSQLGIIRYFQHRYPEALAAHNQSREHFARLEEPRMVAISWSMPDIELAIRKKGMT